VRDAYIEETATVLAVIPGYDDRMINHPGLEWPLLRCFFFFKEEGSADKPYPIRFKGWSLPGLRALWYNLDKEYSREASRMAIPQLLKEINVLKDPQQARERFKCVVGNPGIYLASMLTAKAGDDQEEPFEQYLERISRIQNVNLEDGVFIH